MFPQTLQNFISLQKFCYIFFWKQLYASPWLGKNGEVVRVLEKLFANQKIESRHFTHARKAEFTPRFLHYFPCSALLIPPMQHFFLKIYYPSRKGAGNYDVRTTLVDFGKFCNGILKIECKGLNSIGEDIPLKLRHVSIIVEPTINC